VINSRAYELPTLHRKEELEDAEEAAKNWWYA